jgi:hypothetical protein
MGDFSPVMGNITRGIGYMSPVTWVQLLTGHPEAAKRSADVLGPAAIALLGAVGGGGAGVTRGPTGGVSLSDTLRSGGMGVAEGSGAAGSAGGLFGASDPGTWLNRGRLAQNVLGGMGGGQQANPQQLQFQQYLDELRRRQEQERLQMMIDEMLNTRVSRRLR